MPRAHTPTLDAAIGQLQFILDDELLPLPVGDQPSHRMMRDGPAACSTADLLQIAIGGAGAERIARNLLSACRDVRGIVHFSIPELAGMVHGFGIKKAARLKASMELGRLSLTQPADARARIKTPKDAAQVVLPHISTLDQEEVWVLLIDSRNHLIGMDRVYRGSVQTATMRIAELFKEAIRRNAASIIVAHNHPTGDVTPSAEDVLVTKQMIKAANILDIELLDHLVCGNTLNSYTSLKESGLGFDAAKGHKSRTKQRRR